LKKEIKKAKAVSKDKVPEPKDDEKINELL